ncbi:MAG: hypothetical protein ACKOBW_01690, partial [Planctomycetota bacterium]
MQPPRWLIGFLIALGGSAAEHASFTAAADPAAAQSRDSIPAEEFASQQERAALARHQLSHEPAELRKIVASLLPDGERDRATRAALKQLDDPQFTQREAASRQLRQTLFIPEQLDGLSTEATWRLAEVRQDVGARQRYLLSCILNQLRRAFDSPESSAGEQPREPARATLALLVPLAALVQDRQLTHQLWHTSFAAATAAEFTPAEITPAEIAANLAGPAGWKLSAPASLAAVAAAWAATADHAGLAAALAALPPRDPDTDNCRLAAAINWTRRGHPSGPQQLVALLDAGSSPRNQQAVQQGTVQQGPVQQRTVQQEAARALELLLGRAPLIDPEFARLLAEQQAPTGLPLATPVTLRAAAEAWYKWLTSEPRPTPGANRQPL